MPIPPYGLLALSLLAVATLNQRFYGVFVTNEIQNGTFPEAQDAIYRVIPRPYVVVPKETRERIYAVSPAFAEPRRGLEGGTSPIWAGESCRWYQVCTDNDVVWGWFVWQFREAVMRTGHLGSAVDAARFLERVAAEINAACTSGALACTGKRSSAMPPWERAFACPLPDALLRTFAPLVTFAGFRLDGAPSMGTPRDLAEYQDISRENLAKALPERVVMTGWVLSTTGVVELSVRDGTGQLVESRRQTFPRPDVYEYVKKLGVDVPRFLDSGFHLEASCVSGCYVYARTGRAEWTKSLPFAGGAARFQSTPASEVARAAGKNPDLLAIERGDVLLYVAWVKPVGQLDGHPFQARLTAWKGSILKSVATTYRIIVPVLCAVSVLVFLAHLALSLMYRVVPLPDLVATLTLAMLCSRAAALALVDVMAIRLASSPEYAKSAYPLVLLFCGLLFLDKGGAAGGGGLGRELSYRGLSAGRRRTRMS